MLSLYLCIYVNFISQEVKRNHWRLPRNRTRTWMTYVSGSFPPHHRLCKTFNIKPLNHLHPFVIKITWIRRHLHCIIAIFYTFLLFIFESKAVFTDNLIHNLWCMDHFANPFCFLWSTLSFNSALVTCINAHWKLELVINMYSLTCW